MKRVSVWVLAVAVVASSAFGLYVRAAAPTVGKLSWLGQSCFVLETTAGTRIVIAVGEESAGTFTARTALATAELLGQEATVFPSHHGGFLGGEFGYAKVEIKKALRLCAALVRWAIAAPRTPGTSSNAASLPPSLSSPKEPA